MVTFFKLALRGFFFFAGMKALIIISSPPTINLSRVQLLFLVFCLEKIVKLKIRSVLYIVMYLVPINYGCPAARYGVVIQ